MYVGIRPTCENSFKFVLAFSPLYKLFFVPFFKILQGFKLIHMQESHQQIWRSHNCNFEHWGLIRVVEREGKLAKLWTVRIIACGKVREREKEERKKERGEESGRRRERRRRTRLKNQRKLRKGRRDSVRLGQDEEEKSMKGNGKSRQTIRL